MGGEKFGKPVIKCMHPKLTDQEELAIKGAHLLGPSLESKFEELKQEISERIEKELADSANARNYICQKYDELCAKIQFLAELDAIITGFRSDVKAVEKMINDLKLRLDSIEKSVIHHENRSLFSSNISNV